MKLIWLKLIGKICWSGELFSGPKSLSKAFHFSPILMLHFWSSMSTVVMGEKLSFSVLKFPRVQSNFLAAKCVSYCGKMLLICVHRIRQVGDANTSHCVQAGVYRALIFCRGDIIIAFHLATRHFWARTNVSAFSVFFFSMMLSGLGSGHFFRVVFLVNVAASIFSQVASFWPPEPLFWSPSHYVMRFLGRKMGADHSGYKTFLPNRSHKKKTRKKKRIKKKRIKKTEWIMLGVAAALGGLVS